MASAAAASAATTSSVSYTWQYLQWSDCSVTCGKGTDTHTHSGVAGVGVTRCDNSWCHHPQGPPP